MPNDQTFMPPVTRIKLGLAIMGLILFAAGIRLENDRLRLFGIVAVAAAWLMRLYRPRSSEETPSDNQR
jgi:hypothetical protein